MNYRGESLTTSPKKNGKSDEEIIETLSEYKGEYINLDKDRLVLFSVGLLEKKGIEPTYDKIVVTSFKLFPKKFSLISFPEYPDGLTVHNCLFHLFYKTKKWLSGNAKSGYRITSKGKLYLEEANKMLDGVIELKKKYAVIPKRKEKTFIIMLKKTNAYKKYVLNKTDEITESDILELFRVRKPSEALIKSYMERYYDYAKRMDDQTVLEFLKELDKILWCDKNGRRTKKGTG